MHDSSRPVRRIAIVGGGTAGWITAAVLAARYPRRGADGVEITVIESPNHPSIGVGEGTWPTLRTTLRQVGVSETDLMRRCDAAFKQGSQFAGWVDGDDRHAYLHPFMLPTAWDREPLAAHWLDAPSRPFSDAVCPQSEPIRLGRAPKLISTPEYAGLLNYAYHIDAGKFADLLQAHCTGALGVRHQRTEIVGVESSEDGDIRGVRAASGETIEADFFVDCTGRAARLIGAHLGVPFVSRRSTLFVDRAWAVQAPHANEDAPLASVTISTARRAGWIWDIGLPTRRGIGYAYASGYADDDEAAAELGRYLRDRGLDRHDLSYRRIEFDPGHRREFWMRNCVAIGLSAGFVEPLEASAIVMIELSAQMLANVLPRSRTAMSQAARSFNDAFRYRWDRIVDFLKLHYWLSERADSAFWIDNRRPEGVPEALAQRLEYWASQCPWHDDFLHRDEIFSAASYQYVLYGMGFRSAPAPWCTGERAREFAREQFAATRRREQELCVALPENRALLDQIRRHGLQRL